MSSSRPIAPKAVSEEMPPVPLTIEGYSVLHQMMRVRWAEWRKASAQVKTEIVNEAGALLAKLKQAELQLARIALSDYLEPTSSYLSVIELGLYESTIKLYRELADRGVEPYSDEWKRETNETIRRQKEAMHPRLFPDLPKHRYLCFY